MTHFQWVLAGMARLGLIPPLGGTSNHFSREALDPVCRVNGRWDFHTRHPLRLMRSVGPLRYLGFVLFMLETPLSLLLNPLMWAATIYYVAARLDSRQYPRSSTGSSPTPVFYAGAFVPVAGNAVLFSQKLVTPLRRQQQSETVAAGSGLPLANYLSQQE
ncbi:MAG: hypothetical protein M3Z75_11260 [Actinomycetota bacterium]|nr:hypothetical protein [Actinomycetota bacterium]